MKDKKRSRTGPHGPEGIDIILNGFPEKVPAGMTIAGLIRHADEKDAHVIVELNNRVVFPQRYKDTAVRHGDKVEFINPDFGG